MAKGIVHNGVAYSGKTTDKRQTSIDFESLDRENVKDKGTDKNLLMEYIEAVPKGTVVVTSRYNPVIKRSDA